MFGFAGINIPFPQLQWCFALATLLHNTHKRIKINLASAGKNENRNRDYVQNERLTSRGRNTTNIPFWIDGKRQTANNTNTNISKWARTVIT